jgi:hypothetical protein
MKHILLAALILMSFYSYSQNYKGVVMGDTTYYSGGEYYVRLPWEPEYIPNLLRTIWIKDAQLVGADSVFTFYPSVRRDHNTAFCMDTLGPTWLGKGFTRKPDGTEIYKNYRNEEILIRTLSSLNDTWKITTDSSGTEIWGTISQLNVTQIDNTTDSIKEISLQAIVAGNPVANIINGKKIILSKEHGFLNTFEFYIFPYEDIGTGFEFNDYFPIDTSSYHRVNRDLTIKNHSQLDFQSMFSTGTKWQYVDSIFFSSIPNSNWIINVDHIQDSILSKNLVSPDTLLVTKHRIKVTHSTFGQGPAPSNPIPLNYISTTNSTIVDTIVQNWISPSLGGVIRDNLYPEYKDFTIAGSSYISKPSYKFSQLKDSTYLLSSLFTNDHPIFYNPTLACITAIPVTIAGILYDIIGFIPNANFIDFYHYSSNGFSGATSNVQRNHLYYYKDGSQSSLTWGTPLNMIALSSTDISKSEVQIAITPNPSPDGKFKIQWAENIKWEVYNLNGLKLIEGNSLDIDLTIFAQGLYLLKAQIKDKTYYSKLVK